jgi:tripartite ATP-independent transporter DctM subunit
MGVAEATILIFAVLVIFLIIGVPIGISLILSSLVVILQTLGFNGAAPATALKIFSGINIFTLLAIPFFVLAGNLMNKGGIAKRLINFSQAMTGRIPGSLAHTNVVANMFFGAVSGSGTAAASAMGTIIGPTAKEAGYDENFITAVNVASAPSGFLIPPSTGLITYGLASGGTSIAALFLGGYIPGILWGLSCMLVISIYAKKHNLVGGEKITIKEFFHHALAAIPSLLLIIIVIGGIVLGVFTATEASAISVVYCLILSVVFYKTISVKELYSILVNSAKMSGIIMFLIGASNVMAWVMSFTGIPNAISSGVLGISDNKFIILLIINLLLLFVGTFMDLTPAILVFTPILLPICLQLGMSAVQFGVMMIFNLSIGCITPPVGNVLFVGLKVSKTKLENVMPILLKFYVALVIVLLLTTYVPWLSTFLPGLAGYMK